jgi:hypothetical protein
VSAIIARASSALRCEQPRETQNLIQENSTESHRAPSSNIVAQFQGFSQLCIITLILGYSSVSLTFGSQRWSQTSDPARTPAPLGERSYQSYRYKPLSIPSSLVMAGGAPEPTGGMPSAEDASDNTAMGSRFIMLGRSTTPTITRQKLRICDHGFEEKP